MTKIQDREEMMCPPSHSENAPRESSRAGAARRYVAPPAWEDLSPEIQSELRNVYHGPHEHTRSLYDAFRQVLKGTGNG